MDVLLFLAYQERLIPSTLLRRSGGIKIEVVPYLELAVFVAITWLFSQVRLNIWVFANLHGMTKDQAREYVLRPGYTAYLWTSRIMSVVIALMLAPLMYFRREDLTPYVASAAIIMLLVVWGYLYWRLSKRS